jgi:tripartite ATP-independent transporter DctP family solute receptor
MLTKMPKLLSAGLCILTVGLPLVNPVSASPKMISIVFGALQQGPQNFGADRMRDKLVEIAGNDIIVDHRAGLAAGSENAILAATIEGSVDVSVLTGSIVSSAVPAFAVYDLPFLFRDDAHARAVADGPAGKLVADKFAEKGLVLLAVGKQGFRNLTNSKRPIRGPVDLKGLKIRVVPSPVYLMTFKALGAEVVPMDYPLVYNALKDGRLDGQENPLVNIISAHIENVQKYLSLTNHFFSAVAFIANREAFEKLSPADQESVRAAAKAGADATWHAGADAEAKRLEFLRGAGMQVVDNVDPKPFVDALKTLDPEFEKLFGKELLTAVRSATL